MIAGSGLVEARRENIPIGVNIPGVVTEVHVKKGQKVKAGDPLFRIDDRDYKRNWRRAPPSSPRTRPSYTSSWPRPAPRMFRQPAPPPRRPRPG